MMSKCYTSLRLPCHHAGICTYVPFLSVCSGHAHQNQTLRPTNLPSINLTKRHAQVLPQKNAFSSLSSSSSSSHSVQPLHPIGRIGPTHQRAQTRGAPLTVDALMHKVCLRSGCSLQYESKRTVSQYVKGMRYLEQLKENDELCERALEMGQFTVFYDLKVMVAVDSSGRPKLVWRGAQEMKEILDLSGLSLNDAVLLNSSSQNPEEPAKFALNIPKMDDAVKQSLETCLDTKALDIRRALFGISRFDAPDFIQAYSLLQWHSLQAFCSKCGSKNRKNVAGNRRTCRNCAEIHYPTMKPVVLTLPVDGDRCLVARQPQFPDGMYSALAGFCDMGETLEDTVRREVAEEVGLDVETISYSSSQHWPIPTSGLMLGCQATIKPGTDAQVDIDKNELEDAQWLTREEVQSTLEGKGQGSYWFPPKQALAHQLLREWAFAK